MLINFGPGKIRRIFSNELVFYSRSLRVKRWRGKENELGTGGIDLVNHAMNPFLILDESTL